MNLGFLKGKIVLVTGGTGSFGRHFVTKVLQESACKKIIVFSRDELKQHEMRQELNDQTNRLRFFIGDVRDLSRLKRAFSGVNIVVHAAALKQVPALEYNPLEAIKTNVLGTQNVIDAALDNEVSKLLLVSTDKAVNPISLYGATKLSAEKLCIAANVYGRITRPTIFSVVRYGNVLGSRGSIVETLLKQKEQGKHITITDPTMTRFWLNLKQAHDLVLFALEKMKGGEIFIPKIPSMTIGNLVDAIIPDAAKTTIGLRAGEKLHEILLTDQESRHAVELSKYFVVLPEFPFWSGTERYRTYYSIGKKVDENFCYQSQNNKHWLTQKSLRKLLAKVLP